MVVTDATFQLAKFWSKLVADSNISLMSTTLAVFQLAKFSSKLDA
jgi:hypothetical protein